MNVQDEHWMRIALDLAAKAVGQTSPNPLVGAVLVKDGQIVGTGYHRKAGGPHAEVYALQEAGEKAHGADLYVTLEPCSHVGRTPPCANAVIAAGVRRVVAAMVDPNPRVSGAGLERLRQAGIVVETGVLGEEAARLNAPFITYITLNRPYVLWKAAMSLDGKVATRTGASRWISSPASRQLVHQVRSHQDAIMVGSGTVLKDDPLLTARLPGQSAADLRQPVRIIIDSTLRVPLTARCLQPDTPGRAIVATTDAAPAYRLAEFQAHGVEVWQSVGVAGKVDLVQLLKDLAAMEITSILLEGGPTLASSMLDLHLIDACMLFVAPMLLGGATAPGVLGGLGVAAPADAPRLANATWREIGGDLLIKGQISWPDIAKMGDSPCLPVS